MCRVSQVRQVACDACRKDEDAAYDKLLEQVQWAVDKVSNWWGIITGFTYIHRKKEADRVE